MLKPNNLFDLMQLGYLVHKSKKIIEAQDAAITLAEFADNLAISKSCKQNFIYPMLAAGWGIPIEEFKGFSAYNLLTWAYKNKWTGITPLQWNEIVGGTSVYIQTLADSLQNTTIKISSKITDIRHENNKYILTEADGNSSSFDHLIIATNALFAKKLLQNIPEMNSTRNSLGLIDYFHSTIAVHGDRNLMPADKSKWGVGNIRFDGDHSSLTIYKAHNGATNPIFRSWILNGDKNTLPQPLYAVEHFYHAKVTPNYFKAQQEITQIQGNNNLWFAGLWTHDVDSHNSAIISAMNIAKKLAPNSERLRLLVE